MVGLVRLLRLVGMVISYVGLAGFTKNSIFLNTALTGLSEFGRSRCHSLRFCRSCSSGTLPFLTRIHSQQCTCQSSHQSVLEIHDIAMRCCLIMLRLCRLISEPRPSRSSVEPRWISSLGMTESGLARSSSSTLTGGSQSDLVSAIVLSCSYFVLVME